MVKFELTEYQRKVAEKALREWKPGTAYKAADILENSNQIAVARELADRIRIS